MKLLIEQLTTQQHSSISQAKALIIRHILNLSCHISTPNSANSIFYVRYCAANIQECCAFLSKIPILTDIRNGSLKGEENKLELM